MVRTKQTPHKIEPTLVDEMPKITRPRLSKAVKEIKQCQQSTDLFIPKTVFTRICREIAQEFHHDIRFKQSALDVLQEASEARIVELMEDSQLCAIHAGRTAIHPIDMRLSTRLRGGSNNYV